jgi:hypothetical protein
MLLGSNQQESCFCHCLPVNENLDKNMWHCASDKQKHLLPSLRLCLDIQPNKLVAVIFVVFQSTIYKATYWTDIWMPLCHLTVHCRFCSVSQLVLSSNNCIRRWSIASGVEKIKGKIKLSLWMSRRHMGGGGGRNIALVILNLGSSMEVSGQL